MTTELAEAGRRQLCTSAHPNCVVCSPANDRSLHLTFAASDNGDVQAHFDCGSAYEGYPGILHGGVVASLMDGAMTNCMFARGVLAVTAELAVRFRHPVVTGSPATVRAWIERSSSPRHLLKAEIVQDAQVKATAEGRFLEQAHLAATGHQAQKTTPRPGG